MFTQVIFNIFLAAIAYYGITYLTERHYAKQAKMMSSTPAP